MITGVVFSVMSIMILVAGQTPSEGAQGDMYIFSIFAALGGIAGIIGSRETAREVSIGRLPQQYENKSKKVTVASIAVVAANIIIAAVGGALSA
jgi:hypothetical protein